MNFETHMIEKAKSLGRSIALPESLDKRTLLAAHELMKKGIAKTVFLVGNSTEVLGKAKEFGVDISQCTLIDPLSDAHMEDYISTYYELRKSKGISLDEARETMRDPLHYATMMARKGDAHAILAGAVHTTADVLRAGLTIIKTQPGIKTASSYFIMDTHNDHFGEKGLMLFSDCGMIPDPTSEQLAEIALSSADSFKTLLGKEPKVAMLSFSSKGSAQSPSTLKVIEATRLAKEKNPSLILDGEMQLDAAIVPEVAQSKIPNSPLKGDANVLIFPNLDAGNIGYKLVQRFAKADAYGPLLQGFSYPISDLSRGCTAEEIVMTAALVLTQERS